MIIYRDAKIRKIHNGNIMEYVAELNGIRLKAPDIGGLKSQIDYQLDQKSKPVRKAKKNAK